MIHFLPIASRISILEKIAFSLFLMLARTSLLFAQADLHMSHLVVTPGDEKSFDLAFDVHNTGNQAVSGYTMSLTFSHDGLVDPADYFTIALPADPATQNLAAGSTAAGTIHYTAAAVNTYLPSGTWYVIATINDTRDVAETDYDNNETVSTNAITVSPYTIEFLDLPTVTDVTQESFVIGAEFDGHIYQIHYAYQFHGLPAPDISTMQSLETIVSASPTVTIHGLGPAQHYDIYFLGESPDGNVTAVYKVETTTLGTAHPVIVVTHQSLALYPTEVGKPSEASVIGLRAYHLSGSLSVTAGQDFEVSKDDISYSGNISFPASVFANGAEQAVFVRVAGTDVPGLHGGSLLLTSSGASTVELSLSAMVYSGYASDFDGATSIEETGWTTYSVSGSQSWNLIDLQETSLNQRREGQDMAMQIDGAAGGLAANEDWLISPAVDLSEFSYTPALRFRSYSSGTGQSLKLMYSADYPGYGNPHAATWFDASAEFPVVGSQRWQSSMVDLLSQEDHLHFAFVYVSTTTHGSRWTIDDWKITDNLINIPDDSFTFDNVPVGSASDPQIMTLSVSGFGSVTITASDEFQVSTDGVVYSPAVVVPERDIKAGIALRIRFVPKSIVEEISGSLTFSAGDLIVVRDNLLGRPGLTTAAEIPVVVSGALLYPNPTDGEVHLDMASFTSVDPLVPVFVANSMGGSVAAFDAVPATLNHALSQVFTHLQPGVYFVIIKSSTTVYRTKLIRK